MGTNICPYYIKGEGPVTCPDPWLKEYTRCEGCKRKRDYFKRKEYSLFK